MISTRAGTLPASLNPLTARVRSRCLRLNGPRSLALTLALASCCEFGNRACLLELSDGSKHLPHQNGGRSFLREEVRRGCGNDGDAQIFEHVMSGELHGEIAG